MIALGLSGCVFLGLRTTSLDLPGLPQPPAAGALLKVERTATLSGFTVRRLLATAQLPEPVVTDYGMTTYRITYLSEASQGGLRPLSALVALPHTPAVKGTVAYFHGTSTLRSNAPSQPGLGEGMLVAGAVSGAGFVMVAPDYVGLGQSREFHPYLHVAATLTASEDALRAAHTLLQALGTEWPDALYLLGASQGGHAVLAAQHRWQQFPEALFEVDAAAPIVGPFHLLEISFPQALRGSSRAQGLYLAYLSTAYARAYGQPLATLLRREYADLLPHLFDGTRHSGEVMDALPDQPREMFAPEFLQIHARGGEHWFLDALTENRVPCFRPSAPVRFYVGEADVEVLPLESRRMAACMQALGADATVHSVGDYGHVKAAMRALPEVIAWFDALSRSDG